MIDVKETLGNAEEKMEMGVMYLEEQLARIRAGRANVAILDGIKVESYGSMVPLNQVANLSTPDPRSIAIRPWDKKQIKAIEKAIMDSDVGITPENNGEIIRLGIPVPTEERRRELSKQCNKIGEGTKVQIRNIRAEVKDKLKKAIKDGLSEDLEKDAEADLQKIHDKMIKKVDALLAAKDKEIMTVLYYILKSLQTGLVIRNTGSWYTVRTDDGDQLIDCKIKGNFRLKGIRSTNPVAVGDRVTVVPNQEGTAFITAIEDRRNYIIRKASNLSKQSHIIAANVDQAILVVTVNYPQTSTTFIDRFLASAEAYRVPVILVFNKVDMLDDDELRYLDMMVNLYETVGYECYRISAQEGDGVDALRPLLDGKITVLSGNSGVGKSTLINRLLPDANLRTADISDAHNTGMHTTTFSEMLALPAGGYIIDTPGIKGFGTFDIEREELTSYFKEIFHFSKDCRFSNCTHTHEPGCAVLKALDDHYISASRYQSYLSMLEDKEEGKYRKD